MMVELHGAFPINESAGEPPSYNPCAGGHVFLWAGDPNYKLPEGYPCACYMTVAHWVRCQTCGNERLVPVPRA
jgi:hypothetical protein